MSNIHLLFTKRFTLEAVSGGVSTVRCNFFFSVGEFFKNNFFLGWRKNTLFKKNACSVGLCFFLRVYFLWVGFYLKYDSSSS